MIIQVDDRRFDKWDKESGANRIISEKKGKVKKNYKKGRRVAEAKPGKQKKEYE